MKLQINSFFLGGRVMTSSGRTSTFRSSAGAVETAETRGGGRLPGSGRLADFLRSHRRRLQPEQVGIPVWGTRRVSGLRREELARMAGVSVSYYTRLEQGEATTPSTSIVNGLAQALQLNDDEASYLHHIASGSSSVFSGRVAESVNDSSMSFRFSDIVHYLDGTAAMLFDRSNNVLAHNAPAEEMFFRHIDHGAGKTKKIVRSQAINTHRLLFTDKTTMGIFVDWRREAELAVASLRFHSAAFPHDQGIRSLVGELRSASEVFARMWDDHPVTRCTRGSKLLRPLDENGFPGLALDMEYQMLHSPDGDGRRIIAYRETQH